MANDADDLRQQQYVERLKTALESIKSEYDGEQSRAGVFEGRTGILLTLAGAVLVFIGQSFNLPKHDDYFALIVFLQIGSILVVIGSIFALTMVIVVRTFHRINFDKLYSDEILDAERESDALSGVIMLYREAILKTADGIESRVRWFKWGLWLLFAGLSLVTVTRFLIIYVGGAS